MDYKSVLDFMFSQLPMYQRLGSVAYKADLNNTLKLDEWMKHPHKRFKTIHVAGTNGKGSVSHCLASVLQHSGLNVGLYTSPHLKDFRERIKVNGECIPKQDVIDFVQNNKVVIEEVKPSFFEMTVAMAFDYFAKARVDVAVIEVGLGGRLDSTNIITPECSIITNIGLDHTALLGNTLELIAREKAGIIKENIPVVIGEKANESEKVFRDVANENHAPIYFAEDMYSIPVAMNGVDATQIMQVYKNDVLYFENLKLDLLGIYQQKNMKTVLQSIDVLKQRGFTITQENIYRGLSEVVCSTGLMGRWQILGANPAVICDTGHNKEGVVELVKQIKQTPYEKLHVVWGMVSDKDVSSVLELLPQEACYYFVKPNIPRGLDAESLKQEAKKKGLEGDCYDKIEDAIKKAKKDAGANDLIFIGGSNFVVAEVV
jgi:dihydrofolate synthase/folylpolyglutamate synthase